MSMKEASFVVAKVGSQYRAYRGDSGTIKYRGTDASTVINNALGALTLNRTSQEKIVLKGSFTLSSASSLPIILPSWTLLDLRQAKLKLGNAVNKSMFQLADASTDITILGGLLDGNSDNNPTGGSGIIDGGAATSNSRTKIIDTKISWFREHGIYFGQFSVGWLVRVESFYNNKSGIRVLTDVDRSKLIQCESYGNNENGLEVVGMGLTDIGGTYSSNRCHGVLASVSESAFIGTRAEDNNQSASVYSNCKVQHRYNRFTGCMFRSEGTPLAPWDFEEYDNSVSEPSILSGCRFHGSTGGIFVYPATIPYMKGNIVHKYSGGAWVEVLYANSGTATFNGTGAQTTFTIAHGCSSTPTYCEIGAKSTDAKGDKYWSVDATNITVTFGTAPPVGTNNVVLSWKAEV